MYFWNLLLLVFSTSPAFILFLIFIFEKKVNLGINLEMSYDTFHVQNNS